MTPAKLRLAQAAMGKPETSVGVLYRELGISSQTLYRHVSPDSELRIDRLRLLNEKSLDGKHPLNGDLVLTDQVIHFPLLLGLDNVAEAGRHGGGGFAGRPCQAFRA